MDSCWMMVPECYIGMFQLGEMFRQQKQFRTEHLKSKLLIFITRTCQQVNILCIGLEPLRV